MCSNIIHALSAQPNHTGAQISNCGSVSTANWRSCGKTLKNFKSGSKTSNPKTVTISRAANPQDKEGVSYSTIAGKTLKNSKFEKKTQHLKKLLQILLLRTLRIPTFLL